MQGRTWVWIWNGAGEWYTANAQAQIVADKKSYKVGDTAHLLLVTGLKESWAVVTTEGDTVQTRRLMHATGESFAFDVPINQQSQPNLVVNAVIVHDNQVFGGAEKPEGSAGGAHVDGDGDGQQEPISAGREGQL